MKHTMKRTKNKELNMVDLKKLTAIEQMKLHIHAHNKYMSYAHMETLSTAALLCNCHPLDREHFAYLMYKEKRITAEEYRKCTGSKFIANDDQETIIRIKGKN